jgi:diguanylate cyclase
MEKEEKVRCKTLEELKNKKLTKDDLRFISEVAREVLKFLTRTNIPLTPKNYAMWFEVFCYVLENNIKASDLELMGIFKTKFPQEGEEVKDRFERERKILKEITEDLTSELKSVIDFLDVHQEHLSSRETAIREIHDTADDEYLKAMLAKILDELEKIRHQNTELKKKLEESNKEIMKLSRELEESKRMASTDFLTQVANRASFDRALSDMVNDFYRRDYPFALIMIDIDHFKKINDTYGHQAGDYVLQELARVIRQQLRARDVVARYGGEEFAILLPGVTFSQAVRVAERLRKLVEKHLFRFKNVDIPVTISLGVAVMREGLDETSLLEKADKALYLAKRLGRNQVRTDLDLEVEE